MNGARSQDNHYGPERNTADGGRFSRNRRGPHDAETPDPGDLAPIHPHLLITPEPAPGFRSLDDLRHAIRTGRPAALWARILADCASDRVRGAITPRSRLPGRGAAHAEKGNRDYHVVEAAGSVVMRGALAALVTGDRTYVGPALEQLACLYDEAQWPDWRDLAHLNRCCDLRTGTLARMIGLGYDWMYPLLDPTERAWIAVGLERRAIAPYLEAVAAGESFTLARPGHINNWGTNITGGMGIAGMALFGENPEAAGLVERADKLMETYWSVFGPEGEFNESPGYANALSLPVGYWACRRYHAGHTENHVADSPLPAACHWLLQQYLPPGRAAAYGDTHPEAAPRWHFFASVAEATGDGVLKRVADHLAAMPGATHLPVELLLLGAGDVTACSPEGRVPRGRAYHTHSACITSRSDWGLDACACVVYGKAGRGHEGHGHHDAGQLCIDAHAQRLIIDLGPPAYPADYFGPNRYRYYPASCRGHNVLTFGGAETRCGPEHAARITDCEFDDALGGWWTVDLTDLYESARSVRRTVVHLLPATVVVLDEAELETESDISLRWHTIDRSEPDADGCFTVRNDPALASCRVVGLDGAAPVLARGEHAYAPPFDHDRLGHPLEQKRESYVEASLRARRCRLLTLFQAGRVDEGIGPWEARGEGFAVETPGGRRRVTVTDGKLSVSGATPGLAGISPGAEFTIPLRRTP